MDSTCRWSPSGFVLQEKSEWHFVFTRRSCILLTVFIMVNQFRLSVHSVLVACFITLTCGELLWGQLTDSLLSEQSSMHAVNERILPTISHFEPRTALPGENIVIVGKHFNSIAEKNRVDFGGVFGKVLSVSPTQDSLVVQVPFGARYSVLSVQSEHLMATSTTLFMPHAKTSWESDSLVFSDVQRILLEKSPVSIATGDLNGDGMSEIVIAYRGQNRLSIFKYMTNDSTEDENSVEDLQDVALPFRCIEVMLADVDCDGRLDIITIHHWYNAERTENNLTIFRNLGVEKTSQAILFSPPIKIKVPPMIEHVVLSDLDGDGRQDFVLVSSRDNLLALLRNISETNSSEIVYDIAVIFKFESIIPAFDVSDLDGDKKPEIIVALSRLDRVEIWKNNTKRGVINDASFTKIRTIDGPAMPCAITVTDLNGDGKKELLVGSENKASLVLYSIIETKNIEVRQTGTVSLSGVPVPPVFIHDINSDGKPDILCLLFHVFEKKPMFSVAVFQSRSQENMFEYLLTHETSIRNGRASMTIDDIDNDSQIDILAAERGGQGLAIYRHFSPYRLNWSLYVVIGVSFLFVVGGIGLLVNVLRYKRRDARHLEFSRRLIEEQERERKRIAAEMHDSISQSILAIKNIAYMGKDGTNNQEEAASFFRKISDLSVSTIDELRTIMQNLRPIYLDRLGLTESIRVITSQLAEVAGITADIQLENIDACIEPGLEINIFRIVQESLNNIIKHAQASKISIIGIKEKRNYFLMIEDNGKGFEQRETTKTGKPMSFGLSGIHERARILNGSVVVKSVPGKGTTITVSIPLKEQPQA